MVGWYRMSQIRILVLRILVCVFLGIATWLGTSGGDGTYRFAITGFLLWAMADRENKRALTRTTYSPGTRENRFIVRSCRSCTVTFSESETGLCPSCGGILDTTMMQVKPHHAPMRHVISRRKLDDGRWNYRLDCHHDFINDSPDVAATGCPKCARNKLRCAGRGVAMPPQRL